MRLGLLAIALQFDYVREAQSIGQNRGLRVEAIQHWAGGQAGDSWCVEAWWFAHDIHFKGQFAVPRMQSAQALHEFAQLKGWLVPLAEAQPGDTFLYVDATGHAHHAGIVTGTGPLTGVAGNTSADGTSANGDGWYEHALTVPDSSIVIVRIPGVQP